MVSELQVYLADDGFAKHLIPHPPLGGEDVWEMSVALETGRTGYGFGYVVLSWTDLKSACELYGFSPKPWQLRALRQMETVWLDYRNKKTDDDKTLSSEPFSLELFNQQFGRQDK